MNLKSGIFLILFLFSFILSAVFNYEKINVPYFGSIYKSVWADVIYYKNSDLKLINIENNPLNTLKITDNHYIYKSKINNKINKIEIKNPDKIKQIILYVDKKIQFDNFDKIDNTKNIIDKTAIIILSFFYDFQLYLFSYLFLFLFLYNFKGKIPVKVCFWTFLALALFLRIAQLNSIPFWDDEIYTLRVSENYSPLSALFQDPGNPPLYFILFKIYRTIVQNPLLYRVSSVVTGLCFCALFYFYIKKFIGQKPALFGLFFSTFNIALINFSQEIRCYMLLMLLGVLVSYFTINYKKYPYLICACALLYLHFFGMFFVFSNFLFGLTYFKKKKLKSFIFMNFIAAIAFLPCLIYKIITLPKGFNSWISMTLPLHTMQTIKTFSGHILIFLAFLGVVFWIYQKSSKRKKLFIRYNLFLIISLYIIAALVTLYIKPVFTSRYFYMVYPCYIALCCVLAKNVILNILIFLFFISRGILIYQNLYCNHNLYIDFIHHDIDKTKTNYVFMTDTVEGYRGFLNDNIKPVYVRINTGLNTVNPPDFGVKKPSVSYILNLYLDEKTFKEAKNIELYKTPLGVFSKVEY
ncbi:hypothetical protein IJ531_06370 [bacterium]|nr:hypothetical protein [bacterium]